jgi:hypothetical protein
MLHGAAEGAQGVRVLDECQRRLRKVLARAVQRGSCTTEQKQEVDGEWKSTRVKSCDAVKPWLFHTYRFICRLHSLPSVSFEATVQPLPALFHLRLCRVRADTEDRVTPATHSVWRHMAAAELCLFHFMFQQRQGQLGPLWDWVLPASLFTGHITVYIYVYIKNWPLQTRRSSNISLHKRSFLVVALWIPFVEECRLLGRDVVRLPEEGILQSLRHENFKSYNLICWSSSLSISFPFVTSFPIKIWMLA